MYQSTKSKVQDLNSIESLNEMSSSEILTPSLKLEEFSKIKSMTISHFTILNIPHEKLNKDEELIQTSLKILKKHPFHRSNQDLEILEKLVENMVFFQNLIKKAKPLANKGLKNLKYKTCQSGQALFFAGDIPDNFYMILKGSVFVLILKNQNQMDEEYASNREECQKTLNYLEKLKKGIVHSPLLDRNSVKPKRISFSLPKNLIQAKSRKSILSSICNPTQPNIKKDGLCDLEINQLENAWLYFSETGVFKYICVNILKPGSAFGELGLLTKKPRNATILCNDECIFLYLEKKQYEIVEELQRIKIMRKAKFFKNYLLKDVNQEYILKMIYNFHKQKFGYNQIIFEQNEDIDGIYIIKKGDISIEKFVELNYPENQLKLNTKNLRNFSNKLFSNENDEKKYLSNIQITICTTGEIIGEDDVINLKDKRSYSAISKSANLVLFYIAKELFLKILNEKPSLKPKFKSQCNSKIEFFDNQLNKNIINKHKGSINNLQTNFETIQNLMRTEAADLEIKQNNKQLKKIKGIFRGILTKNSLECTYKEEEKKSKNQKILEFINQNSLSLQKFNDFDRGPCVFFTNTSHKKDKIIVKNPYDKNKFMKINLKKLFPQSRSSLSIEKINDDNNKFQRIYDERLHKFVKISTETKEMSIKKLKKRIQSASYTVLKPGYFHNRIKSSCSNSKIKEKNEKKINKINFFEGKKIDDLINSDTLYISNNQKRAQSAKTEVSHNNNFLIHGNELEFKRTVCRKPETTMHKTKHNMFFFLKKEDDIKKNHKISISSPSLREICFN